MLSSKWDLYTTTTTITSRLTGNLGRGGQNIARAREGECLSWKSVCQKGQHLGTHELTVVVTEHIRPVQHQAGQNPSMGGGGTHEVPPLAEEPLAVGGYWEKKNEFSSGMQALRSYLCFNTGVLNLWSMTPLGCWMTLLQGLHTRYSA